MHDKPRIAPAGSVSLRAVPAFVQPNRTVIARNVVTKQSNKAAVLSFRFFLISKMVYNPKHGKKAIANTKKAIEPKIIKTNAAVHRIQ